MFKKLAFLVLFTLFIGQASPQVAYTQDQQCYGDPEMCAQVVELRRQLEAQKAASTKATIVDEQKTGDQTAKIIGLAAALAVILKLLVSLVSSWKGCFKTDREKAWLKVGLVVTGFVIFLSTNIGLGINWWQSIILAGGGPGSILVHELTKLWPVLMGKKKFEEVDPDGDPTTTD